MVASQNHHFSKSIGPGTLTLINRLLREECGMLRRPIEIRSAPFHFQPAQLSENHESLPYNALR